jgi:hypothetical protein
MFYFLPGISQKHGHGVGDIPVATPDEVSLQTTANVGDFARFSLVKAHGMLYSVLNIYVKTIFSCLSSFKIHVVMFIISFCRIY